jgi:hypothetical protein
MPIEPKHLLDLAKRLVGFSPGAVETDLRRGISTAYYALFHLLVKEAMTNFVSDPSFRTKVGRAFQHGSMKSVCEKYNPQKPDPKSGQYVTQEGHGFPSQVIASDVRIIAATFIALHEAREKADYDDGATVQHTEALVAVQQVEIAFQSWLTVQTDTSAIAFLQELLCRSIIRR